MWVSPYKFAQLKIFAPAAAGGGANFWPFYALRVRFLHFPHRPAHILPPSPVSWPIAPMVSPHPTLHQPPPNVPARRTMPHFPRQMLPGGSASRSPRGAKSKDWTKTSFGVFADATGFLPLAFLVGGIGGRTTAESAGTKLGS